MPREIIPFATPDLSAFARSLARSLEERGAGPPPAHVEMLNLIARAAGHRNVQALRAAMSVPRAARTPDDDSAPLPLTEHARKALRGFDAAGRMVRWPSKFAVQRLALWVLWTKFDPKRTYTEKEVNAVLKAAHLFGDHATLRRELINHKLLARKDDCSEYRKLPARPDPEARAVLTAWRRREREATA